MKKLLTLFLVLGLSSMASALTVSLSLDGSTAMGTTMNVDVADLGDAISLSIISNATDNYWTILKMNRTSLTEPATIINVTKTANAGGQAAVDDYTYASLYQYQLTAASTSIPTNVVAGKHFTFDLTPSTNLELDDTFDFWITVPNDNNFPAGHTVTVTIVPEPMTILLLGIGGLFLRRRK